MRASIFRVFSVCALVALPLACGSSNGSPNGPPSGSDGGAGGDGGAPQRLPDFTWKTETTTEVVGTVTQIAGTGPDLVVAIAYDPKGGPTGGPVYNAYASRDHGKTWPLAPGFPSLGAEPVIHSVPGHIWYVPYSGGTGPTSPMHTTDGMTFDTITMPAACPQLAQPVSATLLYASGQPNVGTINWCRSTDGGRTWMTLPSGTIPANGGLRGVLSFSTATDLYLDYGDGLPYHFDGSMYSPVGQHPSGWTGPCPPGQLANCWVPLYGTSLNNLYMAKTGALIYHSVDGANTWTPAASDLPGGDLMRGFTQVAPGDVLAMGNHFQSLIRVVLRLQPDGSWLTVYTFPDNTQGQDCLWSPQPSEVYLCGSKTVGNSLASLIIHGTR